ncbi:MAG: lysine--tRNA ligase [Puniceicoccales bacterium]|jgi:lysyl-tRNA synthetase class 2|nr:lysine--tRNA ligase [Puniceicoccales bacterium]
MDANLNDDPNTSDIFAVRKAKLAQMRANGCDPFQNNCLQAHTSAEAVHAYSDDSDQQFSIFSIAGRIVTYRAMGKASFIKLLDRDGRIQVYVSQNDLGESIYAEFKKLDVGDIIGVTGPLFKTKTNEITLRAQSLTLVAKSLRPLPEKWHGLTNDDQIYRQRYLDLIVNPGSRDRALKRTQIIKEIRQFLWNRAYIEVETPMLHHIAGGAAAKPFTTHMHALNHDFYLRIALELYLKRMLVAGFDRIFEMGRVFRNEGLSRKHNPEFTMIELYQAYADHFTMMELVQSLILHLCQIVLGTTTIHRADGVSIQLAGEWRKANYSDLIREAVGDPHWFSKSREEKLQFCQQHGVEVDPHSEDFEVTNAVYSKLVEPKLINPTFVLQLPKELCPLAKLNQNNPQFLDVFELCINGQEIAPAYSEQNDPFIQRQMFEAQIGEDTQNLDNDFLLALEYGMPPAGGMGIGVDRLVVLLTGAESIRDVILFPSLKPLPDHG